MQFVSRILVFCTLYVISVNCLPLQSNGESDNEEKESWPTYPSSAWPTSEYTWPTWPVSTTDWDPWTSHVTWPTTRPPTWPTSAWPSPSPPWTTLPPRPVNCYGHYIYKEEHNIIVDGEDDRHNSVEDCEFSCQVTLLLRGFSFCNLG